MVLSTARFGVNDILVLFSWLIIPCLAGNGDPKYTDVELGQVKHGECTARLRSADVECCPDQLPDILNKTKTCRGATISREAMRKKSRCLNIIRSKNKCLIPNIIKRCYIVTSKLSAPICNCSKQEKNEIFKECNNKKQVTEEQNPSSTALAVKEYTNKVKKTKVENRNSIYEVINAAAAIMKVIKNSNEKGHVMKVITTMGEFAMKYAKFHLKNITMNLFRNSTLIWKKRGLIFQIAKVSTGLRMSGNCTFPPESHQSQTRIDLPGSLFDKPGSVNSTDRPSLKDRYVINSRVSDMTDLIEETKRKNRSWEIISPVISSTLDPKPEGALKDNVTIALEHFKKPSKFRPSCVFWEKSRKGIKGQWSTEGCTAVKSDKIMTICSCNHLTSFALLMQVDNAPDGDRRNILALSYITYLGCGFSLLGEVLTVLTYALFIKIEEQQSQIRVNLAISLAVAQIFFLSGITATSNLGVCTFVAVMLHYFYLVAFGWMMLEGVYLYSMVVKVFNVDINMRPYYIFAWGFPVVVVGLSFMVASKIKGGIENFTREKFCWISLENGLIWTFVVPVILMLLANLIILVFVVREMSRLNEAKASNLDILRRGVKACATLFPLLGLTWLFGLLSVTDARIVFEYIFTILNSFQGFLIFVLHVLRSSEIRGSIGRVLMRWGLRKHSNSSSNTQQLTNKVYSKMEKDQTENANESLEMARFFKV